MRLTSVPPALSDWAPEVKQGSSGDAHNRACPAFVLRTTDGQARAEAPAGVVLFLLWLLGAVFRPNGAAECSHGWSGAAAPRPDAEPVESG